MKPNSFRTVAESAFPTRSATEMSPGNPFFDVVEAGVHAFQCTLGVWDRLRRSQARAVMTSSMAIGQAWQSASEAKDVAGLVTLQQGLFRQLLAQAMQVQGEAVAAWTSLPAQWGQSVSPKESSETTSEPTPSGLPEGARFGTEPWAFAIPARQQMEELIRQSAAWWSAAVDARQHAEAE